MLGSHAARAVMYVVLSPALLYAASAPAGPELQLNAYTLGEQRNVVLSCLTTNDFIVAWEGVDSGEGTAATVFAQRLNAAGYPRGPLFEAASESCVGQSCALLPSFDPSVCREDDGDFVLAWERAYGFDGAGSAVVGRRFDSTGAARGSEFQVNTYTRGYQYAPSLTCAADGAFIVVWQQEDGGQTGIFARRFTSAGSAAGTELRADSSTAFEVGSPSVALGDGGDFVVTWTSGGYSASPDGSGLAVRARRFSSAGAALSSEFSVNSFGTGYQHLPAIAHLPGVFVVVWESGDYYDTQDGSYAGIFARRLNANAAPLGSEFQVNSYTREYQQRPADRRRRERLRRHLAERRLLWTAGRQLRRHLRAPLRSAGMPDGAEFQVNGYTPGDQVYASACVDDLGNFLVAWDSLDQDGSDAGLFARRYAVTDLSGHVRYYSGNRPVPAAEVDLIGEPLPDATTNSAGGFSFAQVADEPRTLQPRRFGGTDQGVSSLDSAYVSQAKVGLRTFDAFQEIACDVSGNGTISSFDAALIRQLKVGIIERFPVAEACGSDWAFVPDPAAAANQNRRRAADLGRLLPAGIDHLHAALRSRFRPGFRRRPVRRLHGQLGSLAVGRSFVGEQPTLSPSAAGIAGQRAVRADHTMAGHDDGDRVPHRSPRRRRARRAGFRSRRRGRRRIASVRAESGAARSRRIVERRCRRGSMARSSSAARSPSK